MKRGVDYIGVGVGAAIFNDEGRMFITKRGQKTQNERGKWDLPGGAVEVGETLADALKREIKEENDIDIEVIELLHIHDHILPDDNQHWIAPTFICRIVSGEPRILEPEKCEEIAWMTIEDVAQLDLSSTTKRDIEILKKKYPDGYTA